MPPRKLCCRRGNGFGSVSPRRGGTHLPPACRHHAAEGTLLNQRQSKAACLESEDEDIFGKYACRRHAAITPPRELPHRGTTANPSVAHLRDLRDRQGRKGPGSTEAETASQLPQPGRPILPASAQEPPGPPAPPSADPPPMVLSDCSVGLPGPARGPRDDAEGSGSGPARGLLQASLTESRQPSGFH